MRRPPAWFVILAFAATLGGCGDSDDTTLVVFAASSLVDVLDELATEFEAGHPGVDVIVTVGPSSRLREQIADGAPADVVALASRESIAPLVEANLVAHAPIVFATNSLVLAVPPANPAGIDELADLADPEILVGVCATGVPCGDLAAEVAASFGIVLAPDTEAPDARALLSLVVDGELDVGLVYATDARAPGVALVDVPGIDALRTEYPAAVVSGASNSQLAESFVELLTGATGSAVLAAHGFGAP